MSYAQFHMQFPKIAKCETRAITVLDPVAFNLPIATYSFHEMFCDEPGCDCRRVFFCVTSSLDGQIKAVIAWGWENRDFYAKWIGYSNSHDIDALKGPVLNLASPQSKMAPAILKLFQNMLIQDKVYVERVKRHYVMFREKVEGKSKAEISISKKSKKKSK